MKFEQLTRFARGFVYAYNGIRAAVQEERNFRFHLCAAFYAFVAAFWAELDPVETALIALCVAAVLALELVNSAIERAVDKPDTTHWWSAGAAKDMAAGAVLVMAVGTLIDLLAQHGVQADCVKLTQLYPLPDGVCDTLKHYNTILFAEDTVRTGGIGEQLGFAMQQCGWQGEFLLHAVDNSHLLHANVPELRKDQQLDAAALCTDILNALKEKQA